MAIQMDPELARQMGEGVQLRGGVQLPFCAPVVWAINGNAQLKALNNAMYFGGFGVSREDLQKAQQVYKLDGYPKGFVDFDITTGDNKTIPGAVSRQIFVALIGFREAWFAERGYDRSPEYFEGARHRVQALVMLASREGDNNYQPWAPAMITAKGFQANNLLKSFSAWNQHTAVLRSKIAPNIPAWAFYLCLGTFGTERQQETVGNGSKQNTITPIGPYLPEKLAEATLEALFVGNETAKQMVEYQEQAKEWLGAWKQSNMTSNQAGQQPAQQRQQYTNYGTAAVPPEEPPDWESESDIPF